MKIVTVACDSAWKSVDDNLVQHAEHIKTVKDKWPSVDLILFPELSLTGFVVDASNNQIAEPVDGKIIGKIIDLAKEHQVALSVGIIEKNPENDKPYNSQVVVSNKGEVLAVYRKNHLFTQSDEPKLYSKGEDLVTFELDGWKIGLSICFDIRFPRLFETYKKEGVELIISGFNWVEGRNKPEIMTSLVKARAHENQYFFAAVDRTGINQNTRFYGTSIVSSPYAEDIADHDGIYSYAVLDKNDIHILSKQLPLKDSYKDIYSFGVRK